VLCESPFAFHSQQSEKYEKNFDVAPQGCRNGGAWRRHWLRLFERRARHRCPYMTVSHAISWFIKIDLKQIYCSYWWMRISWQVMQRDSDCW